MHHLFFSSIQKSQFFQLKKKKALKKTAPKHNHSMWESCAIDSALPAKRTMQRKRPQCSKQCLAITRKKKCIFTCTLSSTGEAAVTAEKLMLFLEVLKGFGGHPSELSGKAPSMSLYCFLLPFFPPVKLLSFA